MLTPDKLQWIAQLNQKAVVQERLERRAKLKQTVLAKLSGDMRDIAGQLYQDMNLRVTDGAKSQKVLDYKGRDQTQEFDLDEMQEGFTLENDEDLAKHLEAGRIISGMARQLEVQVPKLGPDGQELDETEPLFDPKEIAEELYRPLVRQGLMAETFVPDEFSQTQEMLKGSFKAYGERLKKEDPRGFFKENFDLIMATVYAGATVVSGVSEVKGALESPPDDFKEIWNQVKEGKVGKNFLESFNVTKDPVEKVSGLIVDGIDWGLDIKMIHEGRKEREEDNRVEPKGRAAQTVRLAKSIVSGAAAKLAEGLQDCGLGMLSGSIFTAAIKVEPLVRELSAEPLAAEHMRRMEVVLGAAIRKVLEDCDPNQHGSTVALTNAADAIIHNLHVDDHTVLHLLEAEGEKFDAAAVIKAFITAVEHAVQQGRQPLIDWLGQDQQRQQRIGLLSGRANEQVTAQLMQDVQQDEKQSRDELEKLSQINDDRARAAKIEEKIKQLHADMRVLNWATEIVYLGFDLASRAIAPLAVGGAAARLTRYVIMAVKRTQDLHKYLASHKDMLAAASPYSSAVQNFCDNARMQALHQKCLAALEFVEMVGAVTACTGIGALAGTVMSAIATSAQAIETVIYEAAKRYRLEVAWKQYKLALYRPQNRKLGLIALKKNPTLAKYAVAWGAVIAKDPLVGDFLDACGLDADTLKEPAANIDKVVSYLEARMPDDSVVVGRTVAVTDWAPSPIELTAACWAAAKKRGELKAGLLPLPTRELARALQLYETAFPDTKQRVDPWPAGIQQEQLEQERQDRLRRIKECADLLSQISKGLHEYKPQRDVDGKKLIHAEMQDVVTQFLRLTEAATRTVGAWKEKVQPGD
ncbi:MAG: hypothetical protein JNM56_25560 [Planctomycetia bacterium]|nr:hypothetical protein [Planctomycetia bacterium]